MQFSVISSNVPFPEPYDGFPCSSEEERLKHFAIFLIPFYSSVIFSNNSQLCALFIFDHKVFLGSTIAVLEIRSKKSFGMSKYSTKLFFKLMNYT
jgi:hypothetical protein